MLAQNFMAPAALGITDEEHSALVRVLGMLERGELEHCQLGSKTYPRMGFNMRMIMATHPDADCGSIGCILGWARYVSGDRTMLHNLTPQIRELFTMGSDQWKRDILPAQAALALRSYLTCGEPRWDEALAA
jgi:hypothetical protein